MMEVRSARTGVERYQTRLTGPPPRLNRRESIRPYELPGEDEDSLPIQWPTLKAGPDALLAVARESRRPAAPLLSAVPLQESESPLSARPRASLQPVRFARMCTSQKQGGIDEMLTVGDGFRGGAGPRRRRLLAFGQQGAPPS